MLGSPRSVNVPLPWIEHELRLVRAAMAADIPVLGHCFGSQLIAKALGATVCRNAWSNIGWSRLRVTPPGRPVRCLAFIKWRVASTAAGPTG